MVEQSGQMVVNSACDQLNRALHCARPHPRISSRDSGSAVPPRASQLILGLNLVPTHGIPLVPFFGAASIYINMPSIRQVRCTAVHRVTQLRTDEVFRRQCAGRLKAKADTVVLKVLYYIDSSS